MVKSSNPVIKGIGVFSLLGVGIVLGRLTSKIITQNKGPSSDSIPSVSDDINVRIDDDNIIDKIELSWKTKRTIVISIPDTLIPYGDSFELNPKYSVDCADFMENIEEELIVLFRLYERSRGEFYIHNGANLKSIVYRTKPSRELLRKSFNSIEY